MPAGSVRVPDAVTTAMAEHSAETSPFEACGFLIGRAGLPVIVVRRLTASNVWSPPAERTHRYAFDPAEQVAAERAARIDGLDVVGYYHSHPTGGPVPSRVDRALAWPGYVYLIVGLAGAGPRVRAWRLDEGRGEFVELNMISAD